MTNVSRVVFACQADGKSEYLDCAFIARNTVGVKFLGHLEFLKGSGGAIEKCCCIRAEEKSKLQMAKMT